MRTACLKSRKSYILTRKSHKKTLQLLSQSLSKSGYNIKIPVEKNPLVIRIRLRKSHKDLSNDQASVVIKSAIVPKLRELHK